MKRVILTITIILIASTVVKAEPYRARPWTMGGQEDYYRSRACWSSVPDYSRETYRSSYGSYGSSYKARPWTMGGRREAYVQRGYNNNYGSYRQTYSNYGGSYYGSRPSTNINVRYNERWDSMGGERSYEQSPDLLGKIIDGGIILGALSIIR